MTDLQSIAQTLHGVWKLASWEIAYGDGRPTTYPYGRDATGLILYTPDGGMAACIARAGRPRLSSDSVRSAPEPERLAAFESFFQYAGSYELRRQEERIEVVHHVTHALNPNFVGTDQIRNVDLAADGTLTLSASDRVPGSSVARHHRLIWKR